MSFLSLLNVLKVTQKADQGPLTSKHGYGTVKIFKQTETEKYIPATHFQFKAEEDKKIHKTDSLPLILQGERL